MSMYPTLEDMTVDKYQQAQLAAGAYAYQNAPTATSANAYPNSSYPNSSYPSMVAPNLSIAYPSLMDEYMGMRLEPPSGAISVVQPKPVQVVAPAGQLQTTGSLYGTMIAPVTGQDVGLMRAQVTHGIREVILCKDSENKVGLKLRDVNSGIFVQFVKVSSPAALAGLRFGDQILQINGQNLAGFSGDKAMKLFEKCDPKRIVLAVRDRPFERTITLHKDSNGHIGFQYKDGKITAVVKDSSAARNGMLTDHQMLEVNGQNVIGLPGKKIAEIVESSGRVITITIMPSVIYDHMIKCMADNLIKKFMDHSIPEYY